MNNKGKGLDGEVAVAEYLMKKGYLILKRNYKENCGEIDLISTKDDVYVFTEVKNRSGEKFGSPIESVSPQKIGKIIKTAELFLTRRRKYLVDCRFDVAVVKNGVVEEYIENAFTRNDVGRKNHLRKRILFF